MSAPNPQNATTNANPKEQTYTFTVRSTPAEPNKKYSVARFPGSQAMDFTKYPQLKLFREKVPEIGEEETTHLPVINTSNPRSVRRRQMERFFEKKKEVKKKKETNWHLYDKDHKHQWEGAPEAQTSSYVLFRMEGKDFKVYPVSTWFNFKQKKQYHTLTLEQAEEQLSAKNKSTDRWFMSKFSKEEEAQMKAEMKEEDGIKLEKNGGEPVKVQRIKKEEDDGNDMEDIDFEEKFEDDEEDYVPEEENTNEDKPNPFDDDSETRLSESGKELRSLLKKEEDDDFGTSSEEEDEEKEQTAQSEKTLDSIMKTSESPNEKDLKRPSDSQDSGPVKKIKTEVSLANKDVEEEEVRKALLLANKIKTQNLVNKFKTRLTDKAKKARFAQIVKKLGRIVEEHGEKYLVLKDEYKSGLKPPR